MKLFLTAPKETVHFSTKAANNTTVCKTRKFFVVPFKRLQKNNNDSSSLNQ